MAGQLPPEREVADDRGLALLPALADTVARYGIPAEHLEAVAGKYLP